MAFGGRAEFGVTASSGSRHTDGAPLLVRLGRRQKEAVYRSPVPHEWRLARGTGMSTLRSDGPGSGQLQKGHSPGLRTGADLLRQQGKFLIIR